MQCESAQHFHLLTLCCACHALCPQFTATPFDPDPIQFSRCLISLSSCQFSGNQLWHAFATMFQTTFPKLITTFLHVSWLVNNGHLKGHLGLIFILSQLYFCFTPLSTDMNGLGFYLNLWIPTKSDELIRTIVGVCHKSTVWLRQLWHAMKKRLTADTQL